MNASDRHRRTIVGLGSVALACTLGLSVHFVAGDSVGLSAGELSGGDGLATPIPARALDATVATEPAGPRTAPAEAQLGRAPADRQTQPANEGTSPSVSPEASPSESRPAAPVRPADDSSAARGDDEHGDETPTAQSSPAATEADPSTQGDSGAPPPEDASGSGEVPRVASPGKADDGSEAELPANEPETADPEGHEVESHEVENETSAETPEDDS